MINPSHRRRACLLVLGLGAAGALIWMWRGDDHSPAAAPLVRGTPAASAPGDPPLVKASRLVGAPPSATPLPSVPPDSPEVQAIRAELSAARHGLANKQMLALEGIAEADQSDALVAFAAAHQQELAEITALEMRLRDPLLNPSLEATLPEAQAAQVRFTDVRRLIKEEGLSLEEAEARIESTPPK